MATTGCFANILLVRMAYSAGDTSNDELVDTNDFMRDALQHPQMPYGVVLKRLSFAESQSEHRPAAPAASLFQAVFDHRQGQAESGSISTTNITEVRAARKRTLYDVFLELSDDPTETPLITFKLTDVVYGLDDVRYISNAYLAVLSVFSRNRALKVNEGRLDQTPKALTS